MKVWTVLQIIPALGTGGAEQACVDVAAALVRQGHRALVLSSGGWRVADLEDEGGEHIVAAVQTKNPARIIAHAFWLARLIRREKIDIVHARSRAPAWSAKMACAMTGTPFVTTFHAAYKFSSSIKKKYNAVMASADRVIAISSFIARHVRESYGVGQDRLRIVERGIDLSAFNPASVEEERKEKLRQAWGIERGEKVVVLPARLSPIKGHALVIKALASMKKRGAALPLVLMIGDDQGRIEYVEKLKNSIENNALGDRIRFVGACSDMPAAYTLADLVLAPSAVPEGFGRVPVEAMAMGIPVVASALGAVVDSVLDGKTGWLLSSDDPVVWAARIEEALALDEPSRTKMATACRARVLSRYGVETMIKETLAVYAEVAEI